MNELLLELLRSQAGDELLTWLKERHRAAVEETNRAASNQPIEEIRLRAGRAEGIAKIIADMEELRRRNAQA